MCTDCWHELGDETEVPKHKCPIDANNLKNNMQETLDTLFEDLKEAGYEDFHLANCLFTYARQKAGADPTLAELVRPSNNNKSTPPPSTPVKKRRATEEEDAKN